MPELTLSEVATNPIWHPCSFDHKKMQMQFVKITADNINQAPFIDDRYLTNYQSDYITIGFRDLHNFLRKRESIQPDGFIFHTAFCGSTLISRNMALIDGGCSIREPNILKELAILKRLYPEICQSKMWKDVIWVSTQLLCRRHQSDGMTFIKPSNFDNNIIIDIMQQYPNSKYLFLHSGMQSFIVSNLKRGNYNKNFIDIMLKSLNVDSAFLSENAIPINDDMMPVNKIILVWIMQISNYTNIFNNNLQKKRLLNFESYLDNPEKKLKDCYEFFSVKSECYLPLIDSAIQAKHSKDNKREYSVEEKLKEDNELQKKYECEINDALEWSKPFINSEIKNMFL